MSVTYTATLNVREETRMGCFNQAVLVIRWSFDGTRLAQLAGDNAISRYTAHDYLHEGIDVLAERTHQVVNGCPPACRAQNSPPWRSP